MPFLAQHTMLFSPYKPVFFFSLSKNFNLQKINLRWTDRDLFFGDKHELVDSKFEAISYATVLENDVDEIRTLYRRRCFPISLSSAVHSSSKESRESMDSIKKAAEHINRFGEGIDENCKTGLYLPAISYSTAGGQVKIK